MPSAGSQRWFWWLVGQKSCSQHLCPNQCGIESCLDGKGQHPLPSRSSEGVKPDGVKCPPRLVEEL